MNEIVYEKVIERASKHQILIYAGMSKKDRKLVEDLFAAGYL